MANINWNISGDYLESCSCDFQCPCNTNSLGRPTQGYCVVIMAFHIDKGRYDRMALDGLNFVVAFRTPEEMGKGHWSLGLIADERATPEQQQALAAIIRGQVGGPMAGFAPLIDTFLGVEAKPITFEKNGMNWSVSVPGMLDDAVEGVAGANPAEPVYYDNLDHPASSRLALAKAVRSHLHAFGLDWDDISGQNNGHFASFNWQPS